MAIRSIVYSIESSRMVLYRDRGNNWLMLLLLLLLMFCNCQIIIGWCWTTTCAFVLSRAEAIRSIVHSLLALLRGRSHNLKHWQWRLAMGYWHHCCWLLFLFAAIAMIHYARRMEFNFSSCSR